MLIFKRAAVVCLALAVLSGCSNGQLISNPVFDLALDRVGLGGKDEAAAAPAPEGPPKGPPLIVGFQTNRVALPFESQRGQAKYYAATDGVEIATVNGFVTHVKGLGENELIGQFLGADGVYASDFVAAVRRGDKGQRFIEVWDEGRIRRDAYTCSFEISPLEGGKEIIDETCKRFFNDQGFENRHWVEADTVICSRQWFHPDSAPLQFFATEQQAVSSDLTNGNC